MKPKMDHRIIRPFQYTPASASNIALRFDRIRAEQRRNAREAEAKTLPIKRRDAA